MNPLLTLGHFPQFSAIRPEHVAPAITQLLARCRETLAAISAPQVLANWANVITPLQEAHRSLNRAWSCVGNLNAVMNSPEIRAAHQEQLPKITAYFTEVAQNEALYAKYKAIRNGSDYATLSAAQKKLLDNELRDFVLGGAELIGADRTRFAAIAEELSTLSAKFSDNVLDAMNAWSVTVDASRVAGVPEDVLATAAEKAKAKGEAGYTFSLHMPSYMPVMQYGKDRALREQLYRAFSTRASDQFVVENGEHKLEWDNAPLVAKILALKKEEAMLLGYHNFAEVSLVPKMAETPAEVTTFLRDLAARAKPFAQKDMADLRAFAKKELGLNTLEAWDITYASEQLREQRYAYSDLELQQYLPENKVLAGLYRVIESLYGVKIVESKADTWHPSVRFFAVKNSAGADIGHFYLDLYARENKQGGAWADSINNRAKLTDGIHTPLVFLTCNLPAPVNGKPALFTHDDVITIFHEFGHGLHVLLSQIEQHGISGWDGVEWDAVELPSQFMENYCYEWDVLQHMTAHVDTGAPLPRAFYDKVVAAKNFQSGMQTIRQLEFGLFDMRVHSEFDSVGETSPQRLLALLAEVRAEVAVVPYPASNRMPMSFSHIFAGGYAAGYYSYKWAEVLSADAYAAFEEEGVLSGTTGKRFLDEVIGRGGTRPAMDNFVAFRGRKPSMDALLRHSGMNG
jgi:oligopeptidase A